MRISVAQLDAGTSPASNLERLNRAARNARAAEVEALFFPELYDIGYDLAQIGEAAPWRDSDLHDIARETGVTLIGGMVEAKGDTAGPFNVLKVIDPERGVLAVYRKRHLVSFMQEKEVFQAGDEFVTIQLGGLTFGFLICYDLRFPEHARCLALDRHVDVLAIVSAWPFPRDEHWRTLLRARAIENQCYVVASNRVGTAGRYTFCGSSAIIDPHGKTLAEADTESETLLTADLSAEFVRDMRKRLPVREDIHPNS